MIVNNDLNVVLEPFNLKMKKAGVVSDINVQFILKKEIIRF